LEKATSFGLPFFYRVVLPGTVLTVLLAPLLTRALHAIGLDQTQAAATMAGLVLIVGMAFSALDDPIYGMYEGRFLWPDPIYNWRRKRWRGLVDRLSRRTTDLPHDDRHWIEAWDRLRRFPVDPKTGRRTATRPTQLGNVLASYEDYSESVYGLHAVAYWSRLWLTLSKDQREEIERSWAPSDGWTYSAAAMLFVGVVYIALSAAVLFSTQFGGAFLWTRDEAAVALYAGALLVCLSIVPYWLSIPGHVRNGDTMMAMFDVFRDSLAKITIPASEPEKAEARRIGLWLAYGQGKPPTGAAQRRSALGRLLRWFSRDVN
jgi:hypothetical protein